MSTILQFSRISKTNREAIFNAAGLNAIMNLLHSDDQQFKISATEALSLFSLEPAYRSAIRQANGIENLVENLFSSDLDLLQYTSLALSNISIYLDISD